VRRDKVFGIGMRHSPLSITGLGGALAAALIALLAAAHATAAEAPLLRLAVLKFGTVSWELDVMRQHGLDAAEGIAIEAVELAGTPATQVALQAGRVDMIVSDWLWVSRQRADGADWSFVPFSTALGALVTTPQSPIRSLADLRGRRLGIAGSAIDKSWLILRLLAQERHGFDLERETEKSFGAPPLLDEQLAAGRLDAVLTYWPAAAKLEAHGMRPVLEMSDALKALGFAEPPPMVGYVVSDRWAAQHGELLQGFWRATQQARDRLAADDGEWRRIAPLTGARDAAELERLRDAFRAGIPRHWGDAERAEAERLYRLLAEVGGPALVGAAKTLAPGTFLDQVRY
jgi:NitT/TauT family transport system substrate-binding protein